MDWFDMARIAASRMTIPRELYEDAIAEAAGAAYRASKSQDSAMPLEPWCILKARYAIRSFLRRERAAAMAPWPIGLERVAPASYSDELADLRAKLSAMETIAAQILVLSALGAPMALMSHKLKLSGLRIAEIRREATASLRDDIKGEPTHAGDGRVRVGVAPQAGGSIRSQPGEVRGKGSAQALSCRRPQAEKTATG